jgi:hypothetical protein
MRRLALSLFGAGIALVIASGIACGGPQSQATSSSTAAQPASSGARLVTSPCVLNAGGGKSAGHRDADGGGSVASASCWFGAECFETPGQAKAGDGFVGVSCEDTACQCEWRTPASEPPLHESFTLAAVPGDSDTCRRLLVDRCMVGMRLASPDAGPGP